MTPKSRTKGDGLDGLGESSPHSQVRSMLLFGLLLRADALLALSRQRPIAQLRVTDVAKGIVSIVQKRNLQDVVALLE